VNGKCQDCGAKPFTHFVHHGFEFAMHPPGKMPQAGDFAVPPAGKVGY
jgi:hypothetical protein